MIAGTLRAPVGRHLFLDQADGSGPLLLDTRLLTGWTLTAVTGRATAGVALEERVRPPEPDTQEALF